MIDLSRIQTIGIAGAGTMGTGIAQVCLQAGYKVILFDLNPHMLTKAKQSIEKGFDKLVEKGKISAEASQKAFSQIVFTEDILQVKAELVIEAIIEKLEIKHSFFKQMAEINGPSCILASNTSSIPMTQIAAQIPHPERVLGIHFFNPAPVMKLVEIIAGVATNPQIALLCKELINGMGKTCVMAKDAPGFIVNRVARHFYVESLKALEENIATYEDMDELLEASGFKMGPFKLMDLIGVDTNFSVTSSMYQLFHQDSKFRPSRIQQQKVDAGQHGRKTGKGFYSYE